MGQSFDDKMSVAGVAGRLIRWEAEKSNIKRPAARAIVAREAKVSPSSLERLEAGRLKFVDRIAGRLDDLLTRKIEEKLAELEHELAFRRSKGADMDHADLVAAASAVETARRCLGKGP